MDKIKPYLDWLKHNSPWLVPVAAGVLANLYNGLSEYPKQRAFVRWLIDLLSIVTKKDSANSLKMPFRSSKAPEGKLSMLKKRQKPPTPPAPLAVAVLLPFLFITLTGCACWQPEHKNDPKCIVVRQIVDCTTDAIKDMGPVVAGLIGGLINGNTNVDWDMVLSRLEGAGIKDAGCILANLENDFMTKPAASPEYAQRAKMVHDGFASWKAKHGLADAKFKVKSNGGTVLR